MDLSYVYRHIRLDKNEPFYIGVGTKRLTDVDFYSRAIRTTRRNKIWNSISSKTKYRVEIIIENISFKEALQKEVEFISYYGRINKGTGTLANLTDGGDGCKGHIFSDEHKAKIGAKNKGNTVWLGRKHSDESKKIMSEKSKLQAKRPGRFVSEEERDRIRKKLIGVKHTEERKANISNATKGKPRPDLKGKASPFKGVKKSPETIIKMKAAKQRYWDERKGKI